jgi:3-phenylpropionate/trans-cinnamate dioxygenase ferredoxin subunit
MKEFQTVSTVSDLPGGEMMAFDVSGVAVAVANVGDEFYAFGDTCTHNQCSLAEGDLDDTIVTCPCHGSMFDVTDGAVLSGPAEEPVGSYEVRVQNDEIQVAV